MKLSLQTQLVILVSIIAGLFLLIRTVPLYETGSPVATSTQVSSVAGIEEAVATTTATSTPPISTDVPKETEVATSSPTASPGPQIHRVENPYSTPPLTFETVNTLARAALVNIFCTTKNGSMRPISGSGVIIDPKGIVVTNAHVAQYVMLAESRRVNLQCQIRAGNPATPRWTARVLYLPPAWIEEHAEDFTKEKPLGTGKHDYALLYIGSALDGPGRPSSFPYLSPDTREAIGFINDGILAASYPAEFLGTITTTTGLFPVTSLSNIRELLTLGVSTVDVLSIGGVIGAQNGSSGGAIVNAWGRLIGIITTTSEGNTTSERDLRGVTLSYVERDIRELTAQSLSEILNDDPSSAAADFTAQTAPALVEKLLSQLK